MSSYLESGAGVDEVELASVLHDRGALPSHRSQWPLGTSTLTSMLMSGAGRMAATFKGFEDSVQESKCRSLPAVTTLLNLGSFRPEGRLSFPALHSPVCVVGACSQRSLHQLPVSPGCHAWFSERSDGPRPGRRSPRFSVTVGVGSPAIRVTLTGKVPPVPSARGGPALDEVGRCHAAHPRSSDLNGSGDSDGQSRDHRPIGPSPGHTAPRVAPANEARATRADRGRVRRHLAAS